MSIKSDLRQCKRIINKQCTGKCTRCKFNVAGDVPICSTVTFKLKSIK